VETTEKAVAEETETERTAVGNVTEETVKRTRETKETEMEESENVADSYQNRCNTRQTDGETILYIL
jgi:hypothetical protein